MHRHELHPLAVVVAISDVVLPPSHLETARSWYQELPPESASKFDNCTYCFFRRVADLAISREALRPRDVWPLGKYQSWTLLRPSHDLNNNCPCNSLAFSLTLQIRRDDDSLASGFHSTPPGANEDLRSTLATQPPEYFVLARRDTTLAERNVVLGGVLY